MPTISDKEVRYIHNFIDGLGVSSAFERNLSDVLFKSEKDCKNFYIGYLGRNRYLIDDLLDYRENILSSSNITLDKFINLCDNRVKRDIFEQVFLQKLEQQDISLIESAISKGRTTLEDIFTNFQKNPTENILKNVL